MGQEIYISLFLRFLKKENIYNSYMEEWTYAKGKKYKTVQEWLMSVNPSNFVYCAFSWPALFWCGVHDRWTEIVKQIR